MSCHTSPGSQSMVMIVGFCPCTYPLILSPIPTKGSLPLHHENKSPKAVSWVVCAAVCQWAVARWAGSELPLVMSFLWDLEGMGRVAPCAPQLLFSVRVRQRWSALSWGKEMSVSYCLLIIFSYFAGTSKTCRSRPSPGVQGNESWQMYICKTYTPSLQLA